MAPQTLRSIGAATAAPTTQLSRGSTAPLLGAGFEAREAQNEGSPGLYLGSALRCPKTRNVGSGSGNDHPASSSKACRPLMTSPSESLDPEPGEKEAVLERVKK